MRPVVNTEKHFDQFSLFAIASGAINNHVIATAVAVPASASQIREGAKISAVYVEMWITGDDAVTGSGVITLEKLDGGKTLMSAGNSGALNDYVNKKNIFHTQMGLFPSNTQNPIAVIKGWFKIPKSKQRFGLGDRLLLNLFAQSDGITGCGFFLYKEQF